MAVISRVANWKASPSAPAHSAPVNPAHHGHWRQHSITRLEYLFYHTPRVPATRRLEGYWHQPSLLGPITSILRPRFELCRTPSSSIVNLQLRRAECGLQDSPSTMRSHIPKANLHFLGGQLQREGTGIHGSLVCVFGARDGNGACSVNARVHNPLSLSNANTAAL